VSFYPDEIERIKDAQLILLGVPPGDLKEMDIQQREDVLAIWETNERLKAERMKPVRRRR